MYRGMFSVLVKKSNFTTSLFLYVPYKVTILTTKHNILKAETL